MIAGIIDRLTKAYFIRCFILPPLEKLTSKFVYTMNYGGIEIRRQCRLDSLLISRRMSQEERFLSSLDLERKVIYDIGAHIGILTAFFGKKAGLTGKVYAFEPHPYSYQKVRNMVDLNRLSNVEVVNIGICDRIGSATLVVRRNRTGTASMDQSIQTKTLRERGTDELQVDVYDLDSLIAINQSPPDFIKIDIEGMEYYALQGMVDTIQKHGPTLYIEIHGADEASRIQNANRIREFLDSHGYSIYNVESETSISNGNVSIAKSGHIYCQKKH